MSSTVHHIVCMFPCYCFILHISTICLFADFTSCLFLMQAKLNIWHPPTQGPCPRLRPALHASESLSECTQPQHSDFCSSWFESFFHKPFYQLLDSMTYSLFLSERPLSELPLADERDIFCFLLFLLEQSCALDFVSVNISRRESRFPFGWITCGFRAGTTHEMWVSNRDRSLDFFSLKKNIVCPFQAMKWTQLKRVEHFFTLTALV